MEVPLAEVDSTPGRRWNSWENAPIHGVDTARIGLLALDGAADGVAGRVTLPAGSTALPEAFGPDGLAAFVETDDLDVPYVVVDNPVDQAVVGAAEGERHRDGAISRTPPSGGTGGAPGDPPDRGRAFGGCVVRRSVVVVTAVRGGAARGARFSSRDSLGSYSTLSFPGFVRVVLPRSRPAIINQQTGNGTHPK